MPKSKKQALPMSIITKRSQIKSKEDRYVVKHHQGSHKITRKEFMTLLTKAAQPISQKKSVPESKETSESRLSDDYNERYMNPDNLGDTEGLRDD